MQISLFIAHSIDQYIAAKNSDLDFLSLVESPGEDYGYLSFIEKIDVVIMGRKTFEKILSFNIEFPHSNIKCIVLSSQKLNDLPKNVELYSGSISTLISTLESEGYKEIFIDGGAQTIHEFLKLDLINNFILSSIPVLLGEGIPLFLTGYPTQNLKLIKSQSFASGLVQNHYQKV